MLTLSLPFEAALRCERGPTGKQKRREEVGQSWFKRASYALEW